jgi:phospholipid/cholesterol/gamma-HCH transport system permease protein
MAKAIAATRAKTKVLIQKKSKQASGFFNGVGDFTLFSLRTIREIVVPPYELNAIFRQCYMVGNKSFLLVVITGMIMGIVLTIQSRPVLEDFGAESWLPSMVSVSLIREIAPVITALICAGKIGSGIGAELGSMRVTEQIDAMEVSASNPMKYLVASRVIATTLMIPLLSYFAIAAGMTGSFLGVNIKGDVTYRLYIAQAMSALDFSDIVPSTLKSIAFGAVIGLIGSYYGYKAGRGTEGVGKAANTAVVTSSLLVFIIDVIAVQLTDLYLSIHE